MIQVEVNSNDKLRRYADVWIFETFTNDRDYRVFDAGTRQWRQVAESQESEPSFRVPTASLYALASALAQHLGSVPDTRALREDYDSERARVDKLTDVLVGVVERNTQ